MFQNNPNLFAHWLGWSLYAVTVWIVMILNNKVLNN